MPDLSPTSIVDNSWNIPPWELVAAMPHPSSSYRERITTALTEAGFRVGRVCKHDFFHMWSATFYSQQSLHGRTKEVRRVLRKYFRAQQLPVQADTLVVSLQGRQGIVAFVLPPEP